jgi:hypothetical protein
MSEPHGQQSELGIPAESASGKRVLTRERSYAGFTAEPGCVDGIELAALEVGTVLSVHTRNTLYRVTVLDGPTGLVLVKGGTLFPEATSVRLEGATKTGTDLDAGRIAVGCRMEWSKAERRISTSRVHEIRVEKVPPPHRSRLTA